MSSRSARLWLVKMSFSTWGLLFRCPKVLTGQKSATMLMSRVRVVCSRRPWQPALARWSFPGPLEPLSPYATSKFEGEKLLDHFFRTCGLSYVGLRYFNVFGPRQRADSAYAAVIPIFISRALAKESLTLYGDGSQTRDFIFVKDVAHANLLAAQTKHSGIYNVGSGLPMSILDLANQVCELLRSSDKHDYASRRPGDLLSSTAAIERIGQDLKWQAEFSFAEGLQQTLEWWKNLE